MKQLINNLTTVCFFLVIVAAAVFPFITSEKDSVQTLALEVINGEETMLLESNIAQTVREMELPCLIHCNPPYNTPTIESNTVTDNRMWTQFDTISILSEHFLHFVQEVGKAGIKT